MKRYLTFVSLIVFILLVSIHYCLGDVTMSFKLVSKAFENGSEIPTKYTCQGEDISPPLEWTGVPAGTKSLALIVDDPDAPDPANPKMTWVHWVLFNIPPDVDHLPEGASDGHLPKGAKSGINDWQRTGYGGPCPPIGRHRYFFKLYALDTVFDQLDRPSKPQLLEAMKGHILAEAVLVGTYQKR